ncbi:MAG: 3-dehydroquinate synthase, partial [Campylobacterales bacterium]|nr:3-dehydroquinate synthase [Campylobacterales bacterium]
IKAKVVIEDEKENGIRAALNYGHTFCHVIENLTNYSTYLHGEAVAIGICMANRLAKKLGFINVYELEDVKTLLIKYDLPTEYQVKNKDDFYEHFFLDKKSQNSKIKFILLDGIGNFIIKDDIPKEVVLDIL